MSGDITERAKAAAKSLRWVAVNTRESEKNTFPFAVSHYATIGADILEEQAALITKMQAEPKQEP
jgi:hypothetical protein